MEIGVGKFMPQVMLPVKELKTMKYQRVLEIPRCTSYAKDFDYNMFRAVIVSLREGNYNIIEGMHSVATATIKGIEYVPCVVIHCKTYEEEAYYFDAFDAKRKSLSSGARYNARVEAKMEKETEISNVLSQLGLCVGKNNAENTIAAISTLNTLYKKYGPEHLFQTLSLVKETWGGIAASYNHKLLLGVAKFLYFYRYEELFSTTKFIKQLSKIEPIAITREMSGVMTTSKADLKVTTLLWQYYNYRSKAKSKMDCKHY